ncbi:MAG: hypothetical protein K0R54_571 [Clostridiaceae bacterium]|nr:hypothetical protein [Clostridiaceae bacterium]
MKNLDLKINSENSFKFITDKNKISFLVCISNDDYNEFLKKEVLNFSIEFNEISSLVLKLQLIGTKRNTILVIEIPESYKSNVKIQNYLNILLNQKTVNICITNTVGNKVIKKTTLLKSEMTNISKFLDKDVHSDIVFSLEEIFDLLPLGILSPCGKDKSLWFILKISDTIYDNIKINSYSDINLKVEIIRKRTIVLSLYLNENVIGKMQIANTQVTQDIINDFQTILSYEKITFFLNKELGNDTTLISFSLALNFRNKLLLQHFFKIN